MSINWLVIVPTPKGVDIPTYGNYGGPGYTDGRVLQPGEVTPLTTPPVDDLDALFRKHDSAYGASADPLVLANADLELIRGIAALSDAQFSDEAHLYGGAAQLAFIDQINNRWGHPEVFLPGEEQLLAQDALRNIERGRVTPEGNEIAAVQDRLDDLLDYAFDDTTPAPSGSSDILVDDVFYLGRNLDVLAAGVDADDHYAAFGWQEGRNPNAFFNTNAYLSANQDVDAANINPLEHYHQNGWKEGRDASVSFDTTLYLINNADVKAAGIDPLEHYLANGRAEGRQAYAAVGQNLQGTFDAEYYLLANPDVGLADVDAAFHFQNYGWKEGRDPNAFFDTTAYLTTYADVAAAGINPLEHYNAFGWKEGRDPSGSFDTSSYLATYTDVAAANINPLEHYLKFGVYEGRSTFGDSLIG
ncbi:hypothetical protein ACETIH_16940 [Microvirga arabica]|uniref:Uncharacterized protein n=1 Tax=Microvirga arabica TaxID=1128671 RepID=A0ABV6YAR7_9HYPH